MAYERGGDFLEDARKILNREVRGPNSSVNALLSRTNPPP